jgi:hypothetical protein
VASKIPDIFVPELFLHGQIKTRAYDNNFHSINELKTNIEDAISNTNNVSSFDGSQLGETSECLLSGQRRRNFAFTANIGIVLSRLS